MRPTGLCLPDISPATESNAQFKNSVVVQSLQSFVGRGGEGVREEEKGDGGYVCCIV